MLRDSSASLAMHRLLLNAARLLSLTCRGLQALAAAGCTSEPSRSPISSASLAWHHRVLDLDGFINELHLSNLHDSCAFWKLLQHRVSSTTGHQRSLNGRRMAQFSARLHLWRLSLHHRQHSFLLRWFLLELWRDQTRSPRHPMIPVLCLLLRSSHARLPTQRIVRIFIQLAQSCLRLTNPPFLNCALCPQSSSHSNAEFFKLGHSSSWHDIPGASCR